jgi:acetyl-CoA carboxylase carboxyltransferase component
MSQHANSQPHNLASLVAALKKEEEQLRLGGGHAAMERQHAKRRMTARERMARLVDGGSQLLELGLWAG